MFSNAVHREITRAFRSRRVNIRAASAIVSLSLHALLGATIVIRAETATTSVPDRFGAVTTDSLDAVAVTLTVAKVVPAEAASEDADAASSAARDHVVDDAVSVAAGAFDIADNSREKQSATTENESVGDQEHRAAMLGRYTGQIQARIERAWERPRAPIGDSQFVCRVRISQAAGGEVTETVLEECNGDALWQVSLARAIQGASPLPTPPEPDVFSNTVTLAFTSDAFVAGGTEDGFEPERHAGFTAVTADQAVRRATLVDFDKADDEQPSARMQRE
jgi:TonB-like protein